MRLKRGFVEQKLGRGAAGTCENEGMTETINYVSVIISEVAKTSKTRM